MLKNHVLKTKKEETSYVAQRDGIEALVERIWKDVLRLNKIGVYDNFVSLGRGEALAAIRVTS